MQVVYSMGGYVNDMEKENCFHDIVVIYTTNMPSYLQKSYWF
ncbi:MAG: hypothetical protein JWP37_1410 [Mucilaginibacter sp.]|nr:hypothetical protein [Mucilaginibacter sp.]